MQFRPFCLAIVLLCIAFFPGAAVANKLVTVKLMVDEEEVEREQVWQQRLASRLARASEILAASGNVRFSVTRFGTWQSNNAEQDFTKSLLEFEDKAKPDPATLCIGFTSQYRYKSGQTNLGGTRGPLRKHILIREGSPAIQEPQRLEVLVHEMAHFLGAAHSGQPYSVMRPALGHDLSRYRNFRIVLDPINAKIIRLVSGEMLDRDVRDMKQLSSRTQLELYKSYVALAQENPKDPVAKRYALIMRNILQQKIEQARSQQALKPVIASPNPGRN